MNHAWNFLLTAACTAALSACAQAPTTTTAPPARAEVLTLFDGQPAPGLRLTLADMESEVPFTGNAVTVPKPDKPRVPQSDVRGTRSASSVGMQWSQAWHALLRIDADRPLDLRPFLAEGTLEFDVKADDMAKSGFSVSMNCGKDCGRRVNQVAASRALAGKGWQHLSYALACFNRDGADFSAVTRPFVLESSGTGQVEVAQVRLLSRGTPNTRCPDYRTQSVTPAPLEEVWAMDWWLPRHEKKLAEIRAAVAAGQGPQLVFIGDSITHGWDDVGAKAWAATFAQHGAIGLGFGGDRTENVLWRLQHGALDGYRAKLFVLMIGTNNTGDRQEDPATTAAGVKRLLEEIHQRQPLARVLLLAVFPRDPQPGTRLRQINQRLNERLATFADNQRVFFQDINAQFMNADGSLSPEIMPDWLHLSEEGYARWARAIDPTVTRLLTLP